MLINCCDSPYLVLISVDSYDKICIQCGKAHKMPKFEVGDKVITYRPCVIWNELKGKVGTIKSYEGVRGEDEKYLINYNSIIQHAYLNADNLELYIETLERDEEPTPEETTDKAQTGGPSSYYDMPFKDWVTTNDQMEYLAEHKWGIYAIHLKDIFKGLCRWGDKTGTSVEYDTRKVIYYGCRVLKMIVGKKGLRTYLEELLDDPQFKE